LRIEPGYIMACLQINENDIFKKNQYTKRARDNYSTATDTERLFIDLSKPTSRSERISILIKISEINLNNAEIFYLLGNEYGNYGPGLDSKNRDISYKKALEIDPNHWPTKRKIFGIKYGGFGDPGSPKTVDDFFIYPDSVSILESDIEKMFNLDTLNAFIV
jgi:hypothetical protein